MNFIAIIEDEQNNSWLSLSDNSGMLCNNEKNDIILSFNFSLLPCAMYETNVKIDVDGSVIDIPVSILFSGCEEENGIPYITPKEIVLETEELTGDCIVTMKNIGGKDFDYTLSIEPEECEWLSLSHNGGILEPDEQVEIILYYDFNPIAKTIYKAILNINAVDSVIQIPITIDFLLNILTPESDEIKVYPNPTTGQLRITNYELLIEGIEIYDVYGRMQKVSLPSVLTDGAKADEIVLDLTNLSAGIYFLKIQTEKRIAMKKIIKN
jgi:hypothetical protein